MEVLQAVQSSVGQLSTSMTETVASLKDSNRTMQVGEPSLVGVVRWSPHWWVWYCCIGRGDRKPGSLFSLHYIC